MMSLSRMRWIMVRRFISSIRLRSKVIGKSRVVDLYRVFSIIWKLMKFNAIGSYKKQVSSELVHYSIPSDNGRRNLVATSMDIIDDILSKPNLIDHRLSVALVIVFYTLASNMDTRVALINLRNIREKYVNPNQKAFIAVITESELFKLD